MNRLTKHQAAVIGAYTGVLCGPMADLAEYVERLLGRPVFTHELGTWTIAREVREAARADFLAIACEG